MSELFVKNTILPPPPPKKINASSISTSNSSAETEPSKLIRAI